MGVLNKLKVLFPLSFPLLASSSIYLSYAYWGPAVSALWTFGALAVVLSFALRADDAETSLETLKTTVTGMGDLDVMLP